MANITTFIARRYLQSRRENRFFSWIASLSITGIAIGVAALIVVSALFSGFEEKMRSLFLAANSHVMLYRYPVGLENPAKWQEIVERDFGKVMTGSSPFVNYETMISRQSTRHTTLIRGIDPRAREKIQTLTNIVQPASGLDELQREVDSMRAGADMPKIPAIILGSALLSLLDAKVGDEVDLIAPGSAQMNELQRFRVVGSYNSGLHYYDVKIAIMSLTAGQVFFRMSDPKTGAPRVTGLEIGLKDPKQSRLIASQMEEKYNVSVTDWQTLNRNMYESIEMEGAFISFIVSLVALVASFNILTTLFISVAQKQRDISILKALGATRNQVLNVFLKQGILIGLVGTLFGIVLSFVVKYIIKLLFQYKIVELPDLYLLRELPINIDPMTVAFAGVGAIIISVIAGSIPSWLATRVQPLTGLKGQQRGA